LSADWLLNSHIRFFDVRVGTSSPTMRASRSSPWGIGMENAASIASSARKGAG
jgi:hypothetical protein